MRKERERERARERERERARERKREREKNTGNWGKGVQYLDTRFWFPEKVYKGFDSNRLALLAQIGGKVGQGSNCRRADVFEDMRVTIFSQGLEELEYFSFFFLFEETQPRQASDGPRRHISVWVCECEWASECVSKWVWVWLDI